VLVAIEILGGGNGYLASSRSSVSVSVAIRTDLLGHRKQKFRDEWRTIKDFKNWLEPVPDNHLKAYFCYCRLQIVSELTTIKKHMRSSKHITSAKSITGMKTELFFTTTAIRKDDEAIKRGELIICGFIAEHNKTTVWII